MEIQLLSNQELRRYYHQIIMPEIGVKGQEKLKQSKVLVVGAGGFGSSALNYLASAGIGTIGISDNDLIEESDLQCQVLYGSMDLGKQKAILAKERLQAFNHMNQYNIHNIFITHENAEWICKGYDVIVDATDNIKVRYILNDVCVKLDKPFVYGTINKGVGQVTVFNYKRGPNLRDINPNEADENYISIKETGIMGVLPGIIGIIQASEALKIITDIGEVLSRRILYIDLIKPSFEIIHF
jgi:molybdopterin/thiamine biosynthesis adenylyltransferase